MVVDVLFLAVFASGHPTEWSTSGFTSADTIKKVLGGGAPLGGARRRGQHRGSSEADVAWSGT